MHSPQLLLTFFRVSFAKTPFLRPAEATYVKFGYNGIENGRFLFQMDSKGHLTGILGQNPCSFLEISNRCPNSNSPIVKAVTAVLLTLLYRNARKDL